MPADESPRPLSRRVRIALWITAAVLAVLLFLAATGVQVPDAEAAAKNTLAAVLGFLIVLAGLALTVVAALRISPTLIAVGALVLLSGISVLATTLGLPHELQEVTKPINAFLDLISELIQLIAKLLKLVPGA